jgi:hypothetical protein
MKKVLFPSFLALSVLMLSGCATYVKETRVARGSVHPQAIYIRPFPSVGEFDGNHGAPGGLPIRESIAPTAFAEALQEQLSIMAPSRVLADDEIPELGWLIDGELEVVHAGSPPLRHSPFGFFSAGRSTILVNVRVYDLSKTGSACSKAGSRCRKGQLVYDFTVSGGSGIFGTHGNLYMPGLGYSTPFDFRNVAERVYHVLSTDPHRWGVRTSPTIR